MIGYINAFWDYVILSAPFLLFGFFVAGIVRVFVNIDTIKRHLGKKDFASIFKAALFGVPLPLCSCAVIPTAVTLKKSGASNGATSSFLISTPESGIDSIAMTYAMMDLPMTIIRPIAAFVSAVVAGILQFIFNDHQVIKVEEKETVKSCCGSSNSKKGFGEKLKESLRFSFVNLSNDIAFWLLIGLLVGAGITYFVPPEMFTSIDSNIARFVFLLLGIPLYICASATTPIAASLVLKGMSPGVVVILMLVGPATNFTNILVLKDYIGIKGIIINVISIALIALGFSYLIDYLYEYFNWSLLFKAQEEHVHNSSSWWEVLSAIILLVLIARGIWVQKLKKIFS